MSSIPLDMNIDTTILEHDLVVNTHVLHFNFHSCRDIVSWSNLLHAVCMHRRLRRFRTDDKYVPFSSYGCSEAFVENASQGRG